MAENYAHRPPYSAEVFETLLSLIADGPWTLLDAGCGPGKITFGMVDYVEHIDAVDPSSEMLRVARGLPGGGSPNIRWICGKCENATLGASYGLIVAGASIHWMNHDVVLPRFREALAHGAMLALVEGDAAIDAPWEHEETSFMIDFVTKLTGTRPGWWRNASERLGDTILSDPRFQPLGRKITAPAPVSQSIADYLRCQHSRATWSEDDLGEKASAEFDRELEAILARHARDGMLTFAVRTRIEWGYLAA